MRWHTDNIRVDLYMYVVESKWNLCSLVGGASLAKLGLGEVYYSYPKEPPPTLVRDRGGIT